MKEREVNVLLEDIRSQFRIFGEGLELLRQTFEQRFGGIETRLSRVEERLDAVYFMTAKNTEAITRLEGRMDRMEEEMRLMKGEMAILKDEMSGMKGEINGMKGEINGMKGEINGMKGEMGLMRSHLLGKVDRDEFTGLEKRVGVLEKRRN